MEIRYGKYIVRSDALNLWVEEEYTDKKGNTATKRVAGYARTFQELYESFVNKKIRGAEAETFETLRNEIAEIGRVVENIMKEVNEHEQRSIDRQVDERS